MSRDEKTRLSFWFPIIEAAGLQVPRTIIIRNESDDLWRLSEGRRPECLSGLTREVEAACRSLGDPPYFLRTDFTSAKHDWKATCYLGDLLDTETRIANIAEFSQCADIIGLPTDVWVVREMLKTFTLFTAFRGEMPITREFRFFVRDGVVESLQPYWPAAALEDQHPSRVTWRSLLADASQLGPQELELLTHLSLKVSAALPGYWSIDWLQTIDHGWVLTDMAEGDKSYQYEAEEGASSFAAP